MKSTIVCAGLAVWAICSPAGDMSVDPPSVDVTATFVQFERRVIEEEPPLRSEGNLAHRHILNMWKDDKGVLLSTMSLTTLSGVSASVRSVREIVYPVDLRTQAFNLLDENQKRFQVSMTVPESFETREVGHMFDVTPTYDAGNGLIALTFTAETVEFKEWIDHGELIDSEGRAGFAGVPKPIFASDSITTRLSMKNGDIMVVGGSTSDDGEWVRYVIVSASVH